MSVPSGATSAPFSSQTPSAPSMSAARAHDVADLVAGLGDLNRRAQDLGGLVQDAEAQLRALRDRAARGSARTTALARVLDGQALHDDVQQATIQLRRLRTALHDVQRDMEALAAQHGTSSELSLMLARCQQDDMRARQADAQLQELLGQDARRADDTMSARRRQQQQEHLSAGVGRDDAQGLSGSHLQAHGATGPTGARGATASPSSGGWQPPAELRDAFEDVSLRAGKMLRRVAGKTRAEGDGADDGATRPELADVQARFARVLTHPQMPKFQDPADLVQWVIRQAHADGSLDLQGYAHKLHFATQLKETIRQELSRARKFRSEHGAKLKDGAMDAPFERVDISRNPQIGPDGVPRVREPAAAGEIVRAEELDAHIADLQNMLASTGEDMQISQLELQNMTQRQQQVMNVLSNLSKALHETSMAIIRKIGN